MTTNIFDHVQKKMGIVHESQIKLGIVDESHKIVMLWTPKAACTMALALMLKNMGLLEEAKKYNSFLHEYRANIFYKKYGLINFDKHLLSNEYYVFKVVRNPYDRAVSSYLFSMLYCVTNPLYRKMSFEDYLICLKKNNQSLLINGVVNVLSNYHSMPQYISNEEKYINTYVHIENANEDLKEINEKFNLNLNVNDINDDLFSHYYPRQQEINKQSHVYIGDIEYDQLPLPLPKSYKCFYNEMTKFLVDKLYGDDILHYGYRFYDT